MDSIYQRNALIVYVSIKGMADVIRSDGPGRMLDDDGGGSDGRIGEVGLAKKQPI